MVIPRYVVFFLVCISSFMGLIEAQDFNQVFISEVEQSVPLSDYLQQVEKSSDYKFFFTQDMLKGIAVTPNNNGEPLHLFLSEKVSKKGLTIVVHDKYDIVVIPLRYLSSFESDGKQNNQISTGEVVSIGNPLLAGKYSKATISGYVRNGKNGDPIPGTVIYVEEFEKGAITDSHGYYQIEVPVGMKSINFSFIGFEAREIQAKIISPGKLDVELFEESIAIDQVVISTHSDANVSSSDMSLIRMDATTIKSLPVLLGEQDIIKTMTLMPGVQSTGDLASGFNVRGGNTDQNLILIDDVPIYNSTHLFGMFSVIDTRTVNSLELFKGSMPAAYGGRVSSLMDIQLREGDLTKYSGNGSVGLFSSNLTFQGPIKREKASFLLSARTTYSDWILKFIPDEDIRKSKANFYDVNAKFHYAINQKNKLSLFTYMSYDIFDMAQKNIYAYSNKIGGLRWKHIFNTKLSLSLSTYITDYSSETTDQENIASVYTITTGLTQTGFRSKLLFSAGTSHTLELGLEGNYYAFNSGKKIPVENNSLALEKHIPHEYAGEYAIYLQDKIDWGARLSINLGLRFSDFYLVGPSGMNLYSEDLNSGEANYLGRKEFDAGKVIKNYHGVEPRFGVRYALTKNSSLKAGYSRNYQYIHMISNSAVTSPTDIWKPCDAYIKPARADQVLVGYFKNLRDNTFETSVEVYYKYVRNMLEYKNGAVLVLNEFLERDLLQAEMQAYGVEFLVRKNSGRLNGWVSYTYSRSFLKSYGAPQSELVNQGLEYPSYNDKPHDISVVASFKLSRRITFSSSFTYSTGRPATYPERKFEWHGNDVITYSDRNKYRLKDYHRLDVSMVWDTSLKKNKKVYSSWVLSVYNVYGRKNIYSTFYKRDLPTNRNDYQFFSLYELSIIGVPIPSISYNIKF